jgi:hypothetical protein
MVYTLVNVLDSLAGFIQPPTTTSTKPTNMSGNASRKKHSGDQPEEPGIQSVKPAPKMRAKLSKRARAAAIRIGKPKKGIRYKHRPGSK